MPAKRKRTKRANGDGALYQRGDGYWVGSVILPDGRRRSVYDKDRAKALEKLEELKKAVRDGLPVKAGKQSTLAEYMEEWLTVTLPQRVAAGDFAESTLVSYDYNARRHIIPTLGKKGLVKLSAADVRRWQTAKLSEPSGRQPRATAANPSLKPKTLSSTSVRYYHSILRACLADAMRDELLVRNVAELVVPPKRADHLRAPLTQEEGKVLLAHVLAHRWRVLWLTTLALGLRRGEALALRWSNLDLEAGTVKAGPVLQRLMAREADPETGRRTGRIHVSDGKTEASKATLPLPAFVVEALKMWRTEQKAMRLAAKVWVDDDLVCTTSLGTSIEPRNVNRAWAKLCDDAGVRQCKVHELRHTAGTWLFEEGVSTKIIQKVLRHSRHSTTADIYTHVGEPLTRGAMDVMDGLLRRIG